MLDSSCIKNLTSMSLIKMCDFTKISFHFISDLGIYSLMARKY